MQFVNRKLNLSYIFWNIEEGSRIPSYTKNYFVNNIVIFHEQ